MSDLKTYLKAFPYGAREMEKKRLAHAAGVAWRTVESWAAGRRACPPDRAQKIERETDGQVSAIALVFGKIECDLSER
ncbi:MAG: helix-turn-helix domain-containing protein [Magnetococcales bacterium]|nr:helix-turn-helix domain-containing protein [Magnetococcales bacterium]